MQDSSVVREGEERRNMAQHLIAIDVEKQTADADCNVLQTVYAMQPMNFQMSKGITVQELVSNSFGLTTDMQRQPR